MKITKHTVPSVSYSLFVDGQLVDQAMEDQPLVYLAGAGNMIPGFERELEGMTAGDEFSFKLSSEEAYGDVNPEAVVELGIDVFKVDGKVDPNVIAVGKMVPMQDQAGNPLRGIVVEMSDEAVKMDFNHPLAGKELNFTGKVVEVREAAEEEISHGHVHGPNGHEH